MPSNKIVIVIAVFMFLFLPAFSILAQESSNWHYIQIDSTKQKWGDWAEPEWLRYFGLAAGDVNFDDVLHEGMATGDVDNDGDPDIVATGMIYLNPGSDISQPWGVENLDQIWNNQEGDWSRNGTKSFMHDLDGDGQVEIFMSHSERAGYPLAYYKRTAEGWKKTVLKDSIAACHTLQAFDFDLDGDIDVLAGINFGRAVNLNKDNFDVSIFVNSGDDQVFKEMVIESDGIYNGQALDYDGDGDMDIFRYPQHEATDFYLMENKVRD